MVYVNLCFRVGRVTLVVAVEAVLGRAGAGDGLASTPPMSKRAVAGEDTTVVALEGAADAASPAVPLGIKLTEELVARPSPLLCSREG